MSLFRRHHSIEDETVLMPSVIADSVVAEIGTYLWFAYGVELRDGDKLADMLADRAERTYQKSALFRKQLQTHNELGRDRLYAFMRHWLAAHLKKELHNMYLLLPRGFEHGEPPPQRNEGRARA